jgi:maltose/maltodextrin transport system permease protein
LNRGWLNPAWRYLLPGILTALVFVVFPMLYTVSLGFTNMSSSNLLEYQKARQYLLEERLIVNDSETAFKLYRNINNELQIGLNVSGQEYLSVPFNGFEKPDESKKNIVLIEVASKQTINALPEPLSKSQVVQRLAFLRMLELQISQPTIKKYSLTKLQEFSESTALYTPLDNGSLQDSVSQIIYTPDHKTGFFVNTDGDRLQPGFRVNVGLQHYARLLTDERFRAPFLSVLLWTIVFAALSVSIAAGLGMLLAVLLDWQELEGRAIYRLVLFLPYAVPGFISILVFKGLFNQNLGEINLILGGLFGIKPAWFSDPFYARLMLVLVNVWLGFPYMMVLCAGLIKTIPADLYEASAVAGAGTLDNFFRITLPLICKPLMPLLISAFAFNFNNFVLISLLTNGRPDQLDTALPAGTTDILVSYTWRIAFQDSGQQFGLASAISTVIFLLIAGLTLLQMRAARYGRFDRPKEGKQDANS